MCSAGKSSEYGYVLRIDEDLATVDRCETSDDTVSEDILFLHVELESLGLCQRIDFPEGTGIHQRIDPFAARQFPLCLMCLKAI